MDCPDVTLLVPNCGILRGSSKATHAETLLGYVAFMVAAPLEVATARVAIDEIDHAIVELLARRRAIVSDLFAKKRALGLPLFDADRELALLADRRGHAERVEVPGPLVDAVFRAVLEDSHTLGSK